MGGAALAAGGVYLMLANRSARRCRTPGPAGIGLGLGLVVFLAPDSFRAAAHAGAPRTWSVAAAALPGGAFLSATGAF